jgi:release factor glutamine methyltransferase
MTPSVQAGKAGRSTLDSVIAEARRRLGSAGIESAHLEAPWLLEHALGLTGLMQIVDRRRSLSEHDISKVDEIVSRRVAREPLQYILGTQEFCGLAFEVNPSVLIPRPETELLVREVRGRLPQGVDQTIVDAGTGSGCVAVALARFVPGARLLAIDQSASALETAKRNERRHGLHTTITWLQGDWLAALSGLGCEGSVTAIVSNPPYIGESEWAGLQPEVSQYEPRMALVAGPTGTEMHERLLEDAVTYLMPGGFLAMELGQGQACGLCAKIKSMSAYDNVEVVPDDAGIDRVVIAHRAK